MLLENAEDEEFDQAERPTGTTELETAAPLEQRNSEDTKAADTQGMP